MNAERVLIWTGDGALLEFSEARRAEELAWHYYRNGSCVDWHAACKQAKLSKAGRELAGRKWRHYINRWGSVEWVE